MKFGKEFVSQMVPEWQGAYVDYNYLKKLIKDIHVVKKKKSPGGTSGLKRKMTLYRAFSGLTQIHSKITSTSSSSLNEDIEDQVILVNAMERGGGREENYYTKFLMSHDEGGEYELVFFRRLDDEFNKVDKFYKGEVEKVMEEAALLNKQMDALIAFRVRVENLEGSFDWAVEMNRLATDVATSVAVVDKSSPATCKTAAKYYSSLEEDGHTKSGRIVPQMDIIEENNQSNEDSAEDSAEDMVITSEAKPSKPLDKGRNSVHVEKPRNIKGIRPAPLEVLNRVKYNNTLETPRSTLKGILKVNKNNNLNFRTKDLKKVEDQLKRAFIEFYQKLRLLKSYSFLNLLAFSKIMKKYDKISSRNASVSYLKMVDNSFLGSSDEVTRLLERVEATFIKHFTNANRSKGIQTLRPKPKKERHRTTFSLGFFSGCAVSLIVALLLIIRARHIIDQEGSARYMETLFPLYSLFGFIVLHLLMYGGNIYFWRRYRVNYSFIFGFKQTTELGYREVFLISSGIATLALASVLSNLDMEMDVKTHDYKAITELVPMGLVILVLLIIVCPFNIIFHSSRFFLLTTLFRALCAPLYKVTLPDFFLADQLTSQVQAFRSLEFYICYYGWGDYKHRRNTCSSNVVYSTFYFIIATVPYWSRFFQCLRRMFEEKDAMQGYNGLKYFSTIVAVLMRTAYSHQKTTGWRVLAWSFSAISAIVSTYWDIVIDWGLLQKNSRNRYLRDKLLVSRRSVYFGAMVMNVLLRFAWLQTWCTLRILFPHKEALNNHCCQSRDHRRGVWNFFRLENAHLNNVESIVHSISTITFNYHEEEEKIMIKMSRNPSYHPCINKKKVP
ncbi:hypothetical protein GIB67_033782 [Kingdonia uniflora]|uniref:Uncharacterized protein n=1 Tax=Kingdonia uniflora TaxID=39325 RepID=A0A7J7P4H7_9MAGN|nr:hypothetical protein GIB67_033782 [Kingdonia uniflora]